MYRRCTVPIIRFLNLFIALSLLSAPVRGQGIPTPKAKKNLNALRESMGTMITVRGRLKLMQRPKGESWFVLHGEDGTMYRIIGGITDKLSELLVSLGSKNIVEIRGNKTGTTHLVCDISYKFDENNKQHKKVKCIRYHELEAYEVTKSEESNIKLNPPKRDKAAENQALQTSQYNSPGFNPTPSLTERTTGQCEGTIKSVDVTSPFKTISVETYVRGKPLVRQFVLSGKTIIVRKIGDEEPMTVMPTALKERQKVTVVYSRDEFKSEALFITITSK